MKPQTQALLPMRRRDFLAGLGSLPVAVAVNRAVARDRPPRAPYVNVGEFPDSIVWHLWDRPSLPVGPLLVHEIKPWDGSGYPVIMARTGWRVEDRVFYDGGYDHDWSVIRRDVPADFWRQPWSSQYPNVHAYLREQRFGEPPSLMREIMARNQAIGPPQDRLRVAPINLAAV